MANTKIGNIYRIIHNESNITYIGSTFNRLSDRFRSHKDNFKKYLNNEYYEIAIYPFFKEYGIENFTIVLIKKYEVCDKKQLLAIEQLYINKLNCINKYCAFQPINKKNNKEYHKQNKEYRDKNKEHKKKIDKEYRDKNKDKMSEKILCECGSNIRKLNISTHLKTKKHLNYISNNILLPS